MIWCFVVLFIVGDIWCYARAGEVLALNDKRLKFIPGSGIYLYLKSRGAL